MIPAPLDEAVSGFDPREPRSGATGPSAAAAWPGLISSSIKTTAAFYLNEINTLPGFTSISMYPKLWAHSGLEYRGLIDTLIDLAMERHRARMKIRTDR